MLQVRLFETELQSKVMNSFAFIGSIFGLLLLVYALVNWLPHLPEPIGSRSNMFVTGTKITILLSVLAGIFGLAIGIAIGLAKLSHNKFLANFARIFIWLLRGTPLLTQILFVYYVVPILIPGLTLSEFNSALIALSLNVAAYNAEVVRAGILAIPKGQYDAGIALGLSRYSILRWIIFPQALKN